MWVRLICFKNDIGHDKLPGSTLLVKQAMVMQLLGPPGLLAGLWNWLAIHVFKVCC